MSNFMAVEGLTIAPLAPITGGKITINSSPSEKVKIQGKKVYSGDLSVTIANSIYAGLTQTSPCTITIQPKMAKKAKVDNKIVLVVGDKGESESVVTFQSGNTTNTSKITLQITDAGQDKVKVN